MAVINSAVESSSSFLVLGSKGSNEHDGSLLQNIPYSSSRVSQEISLKTDILTISSAYHAQYCVYETDIYFLCTSYVHVCVHFLRLGFDKDQ